MGGVSEQYCASGNFAVWCVLSHLVLSDSLQPHELQHSRLLCPWDFPGKNTGVGCHFLLQGRNRLQFDNAVYLCTMASSGEAEWRQLTQSLTVPLFTTFYWFQSKLKIYPTGPKFNEIKTAKILGIVLNTDIKAIARPCWKNLWSRRTCSPCDLQPKAEVQAVAPPRPIWLPSQ